MQGQIDILNADYRKLNADAANTPGVFAPLVADARVQFCLATRSPNGNSTNGIDRRSTTVAQFNSATDDVKAAATGGVDAWNTAQYLNIWCCNVAPDPVYGVILGYGTFPGSVPSPGLDGVVINYISFGKGPHLAYPGQIHLGRTATHEVGHWLNLRHVWGNNLCGDDLIADTPKQYGPNRNKPSFPRVSSCSGVNNAPNGDMFMSYMDYSDDDVLVMFSAGQAQRMQAVIAPGGFRESLKNSPGLNPVIGFSSTAPATLLCGDQTDYNFRVTPVSVGCGGGSIQYQWTATNGWTVTNPNGFSPQIIPNGTSGSTITLTGTYYNASGGVLPLNTVSATIGFSGQLSARPLFLYGGGGVTCPSVTETFGVAPVSGATGYRWTLPVGFTTPAGLLNAAGQIITAGPD